MFDALVSAALRLGKVQLRNHARVSMAATSRVMLIAHEVLFILVSTCAQHSQGNLRDVNLKSW